jgi:hypothetical protein
MGAHHQWRLVFSASNRDGGCEPAGPIARQRPPLKLEYRLFMLGEAPETIHKKSHRATAGVALAF